MPQKPVVFVPGFPASELLRKSNGQKIFPPQLGDLLNATKKQRLIRLLCGPDSPPGAIVAGEPIRDVLGIAKQAQSLYERLQEYGYTIGSGDNFRAVGWDWRKAIDDASIQNALAEAIELLSQRNGGAKVVVIAHSTGGLVLRSLLEARPALAPLIDQVLAFGIPWAGALKSLRYLAKGERFGIGPASLKPTEVRTVMRHAQAAFDLCPPDPQKTAMTTEAGVKLDLFVDAQGVQRGPLIELAWAGSPPDPLVVTGAAAADARLGTRSSVMQLAGQPTPAITNVVGWGGTTDVSCVLDARGKLEFRTGKEGDTTVAAVSAGWLRGATVRTFFLPIGLYPTSGIPQFHPRLWDSPPVSELFDQVLDGKPAGPFVCGAVDSDEAIDKQSPVTLRLTAADDTGAPLPAATVKLPGVTGSSKKSFGGRPRMDLVLKRNGLSANVAGTDFFRFVALIEWSGGAREIPMLIRV
jgi:pimeloyl-ACP methyl ester carboxylesterase